MSLLKTVREVINICRNPVQLTKYTWAELTALDTRIDNVEAGTVAEGSIGTDELADKAVTTDKIDDEAVDTGQIAAGAATKTKIGYKVVIVNVSTGNANGSSSADTDLVGGEIIGIISAGNQDQLLDNVVLNGDGSVTATLADNATAQNNFKVTVLKP